MNNIVFLPKKRPTTLVFVIEDSRTNATFLSANKTGSLESIASYYAAPIVLPLFDLNEQQSLNFREILSGNYNDLIETGKNYNADLIMVAKISRFAGIHKMDTCVVKGKEAQFIASGRTLETVFSDFVSKVALYMTDNYGISSNNLDDAQNLKLRITNIENIKTFSFVTEYLKSLANVSAVNVDEVNEGCVIFDLTTCANIATIRSMIDLDRVLESREENIESEDSSQLSEFAFQNPTP